MDLNQAANFFLIALTPIALTVVAYYTNRFIKLQERRHAQETVEVAVKEGVALAVAAKVLPEKAVEIAAAYVATTAAPELKTLKVEPEALKDKVLARVSESRSMII